MRTVATTIVAAFAVAAWTTGCAVPEPPDSSGADLSPQTLPEHRADAVIHVLGLA